MNKKSILWLTFSLAGVFSFCYYGQCQTSKEVNWNYMGVYASKSIPAGAEVKFADIEQKPLSNTTKPSILADNIKSTFSAVDRRAKRTISKGELLMKTDFGVQTPMVGRPHPENEIY
ncbi:MAG: hypothetical protein Q8T09_07205 [Candidatus Melainabacteria bacterium]|nr:hypothetical protein [Candidatus Melainabacteria bacterium]